MEQRPPGEEIYHGRVLTLRLRDVPLAGGGTSRYEIVEHADAVAIVALRSDPASGPDAGPRVALVRQQRPAIGRETWEIPAGLISPNGRGDLEDAEDAAARELREETGYAAGAWRLLTREYPSPGFTTEAITIFLATGVQLAPGANPGVPSDPGEITEVQWVPLRDAWARCATGEIADGKTLLGLCLAREALAADAALIGEHAMPLDPTNMPFKRTGPGADDDAPASGDIKLDVTLKLDNMLLEEFNYAGVTAYQAMEDRARMFNLYLLLLGVVASALGAIYQLGKQSAGSGANSIEALVVLLLAVGGVLGFAFFLKIIRLRNAFRDSEIAMNVIKEYYIEHFKRQIPNVEHVFHWRLKTIPTGERFGSVTFVICYTIAFLSSLCFAVAVFVAYQSWLGVWFGPMLPQSSTAQAWLAALVVAAVALLLHIVIYSRLLNKHHERDALQKIADVFGIEVKSGTYVPE